MRLAFVRSRSKKVWRALLARGDRYGVTRRIKCWVVPHLLYRRGERCQIEFDRDLGAYVHHFAEAVYVRDSPGIARPSLFRDRIERHALRACSLAEGGVVVELGAGTGTETVLLSKMVGRSGRILAVEAHPRTARLLDRCVELNDLPNVDVQCLAVANAPGTLTITSEAADVSNSIRGSEGGLTVTAMTLDQLTSDFDTIDLLKINIEGAERGALEAGVATLTKARQVVVSCHDFKADRTGDDWFRTRRWVEETLEQAGFALEPPIATDPPWLRDTVYGSRPAPRAMDYVPA